MRMGTNQGVGFPIPCPCASAVAGLRFLLYARWRLHPRKGDPQPRGGVTKREALMEPGPQRQASQERHLPGDGVPGGSLALDRNQNPTTAYSRPSHTESRQTILQLAAVHIHRIFSRKAAKTPRKDDEVQGVEGLVLGARRDVYSLTARCVRNAATSRSPIPAGRHRALSPSKGSAIAPYPWQDASVCAPMEYRSFLHQATKNAEIFHIATTLPGAAPRILRR